MFYTVIEATSPDDLKSQVEENLLLGWHLIGGVAAVAFPTPVAGKAWSAGHEVRLYQAMALCEEGNLILVEGT